MILSETTIRNDGKTPDEFKSNDLDNAYKYFELHANQRMALFNFFLVLSGFALAGLATIFQNESWPPAIGAALGGLLALISFVFWKLDQRTAFLLKHAETILSTIEQSTVSPRARIFSNEPSVWKKAQESPNLFFRPQTYGFCFRLIFLAMALVGIAGCIIYMSKLFF